MLVFQTINEVASLLHDMMRRYSKPVHTEKWQSRDVRDKPDMATLELTDVFWKARTLPRTVLELRGEILPNLPWADEHFEERVSGVPHNPPPSWVRWPWAHSAGTFRTNEIFSHTYPERYWPKLANNAPSHKIGVRYRYGDLGDVINLLNREPNTRQAYLPIFFPEDTGVVHGERVPCTLGYHFMVREGKLNLFYPIRSCDFRRHFRDDVYLTVRLQMWVLSRLRELDEKWNSVQLGSFSMWIGSLHVFVNDHREMFSQP